MMDQAGTLSDARAAIVVGCALAHPAVHEELVAASGLIAVHVAWPGAAETIGEYPRIGAVLIEASDATAEEAGQLSGIVAAAEANGLTCVVVFGTKQLDPIGGALLGGNAVLLCAPEPVEIVAALTLAAFDQGTSVRDSSHEAARLQRLNEEVAKFTATLARLTSHSDDPLPGLPVGEGYVADPGRGFHPTPVEVDAAAIRRVIRARRMRDDAFALSGLFEDPAWDMLLDLYAAELERRQVSVSSLCIAAAVAPTTALRWISKLIEAGLLDRRPDDFDRRRAFISLSASSSAAMANYFAALRRAGLGIA